MRPRFFRFGTLPFPAFALVAVFALIAPPGSSVAAAISAPPALALSADLDGDGTLESVTARPHHRKLQIEVRAASGKVLASADAPAPASGTPVITFSAGALGSSGALVEVVATAASEECRSVWRFRDGSLSRVPLSGPPAASLSDCGPARWTYSWNRPSDDAPAQYRREKTRETTDGKFHQVESFRYEGFRLVLDPSHSTSEIRGIAIPAWYAATLYRKDALDNLYARFDLAALRNQPRLKIRTDPAAGVFALRIDRAYGEWTLPVTALEKGTERNEVVLLFGPASAAPAAPAASTAPTVSRKARVTLPGGGNAPVDVLLAGFGAEVDGLYGPAMRLADGALRIYESADDELAVNGLVGTWTGPRAESLSISVASSEPVLLGIGKDKFRVDLQGAPEGLDALLLPGGNASPLGVVLRGPNAFERVPVRCDKKKEIAVPCHAVGKGELLHRLGARMNAR